MQTLFRWNPLLAIPALLLAACSGGGDAPAPTSISPLDDASPVTEKPLERPVFFPSAEQVAMTPTDTAPPPATSAPEAPPAALAPPPDTGITGITIPGFGDLADALSGGVPDAVEPTDGAVLPRLQNQFRSNTDFDLWGCNPTERTEPLIVYSYLGAFGVLSTPDPVTGSLENAQAATYTVRESAPGTIMLSFLGLGRAEEIGQFRFSDDGNGYEAFSSTYGPLACARISAGELV